MLIRESVMYQEWREEIYQEVEEKFRREAEEKLAENFRREAEEKFGEKFRREAEEKLKIARLQGIEQVARNLLASGMPLEQIAGFTGLELEQIQGLSNGHS